MLILWVFGGLLVLGGCAYLAQLLFDQWSRQRASHRRAAIELQDLLQRVNSEATARRSDSPSPGWSGWRKFVVASKLAENADVCSFYLRPHDGKALPGFLPGQFLTFNLPVSGEARSLVRCYSLSDAPGLDYYRVSIKRLGPPPNNPALPPGRGSNHFHDQVREGDILDVRAPSGHFHLDPGEQRPLVLLAGGIGVTPMISILRHLVLQQSRREVWFFHGLRHSGEKLQGAMLQQLAREHPNLKLRYCFNEALDSDVVGVDYHHDGFVSVDLLKRELPSNNYLFFLCGPGPFMESLTRGLEEWGVPESDILFEAFGPSTVKKRSAARAPDGAATATATATVSVEFARSGKSVPWSADCETLLDLAESAGVDIASGCRAGNCGTCLTAVRRGDVEYLSPPGSPPERGSCLVCVAAPKTDLVLDA